MKRAVVSIDRSTATMACGHEVDLSDRNDTHKFHGQLEAHRRHMAGRASAPEGLTCPACVAAAREERLADQRDNAQRQTLLGGTRTAERCSSTFSEVVVTTVKGEDIKRTKKHACKFNKHDVDPSNPMTWHKSKAGYVWK